VARAGRHSDHLLEAERPDLLRHQLIGLIAVAQLVCFILIFIVNIIILKL
jgi:hypothetical protein